MNQRQPITADDPRHGTTRGYRAGCTFDPDTPGRPCPACRAAMARHARQLRHYSTRGRPAAYPAVLTRRRLQALMVMGWPSDELGRRLGGVTGSAVQYVMRPTRRTALAATYHAVAKLYDELAMLEGPSAVTRQRARARGWVGPLAWDDDPPGPGEPNHYLDDPAATPWQGEQEGVRHAAAGDVQARDLVLAGVKVAGLNRRQRLDLADQWQRLGRSLHELDRIQGWNIHRDRRLAGNQAGEALAA